MALALLLASVIGGVAAIGADQSRPPPPELVWPDPNEKKAKLRGADSADALWALLAGTGRRAA